MLKLVNYVGTKIIMAIAMTRGDYNEYRGWTPPEGEDQNVHGYLVEYTDGGNPNHPNHNGYISWSPKEQFENAYRKFDALTFGVALEVMKQGRKVARANWAPGECMARSDSGPSDGGTTLSHFLFMKDGGLLASYWNPTQEDALAEDWKVVD